MTPEGIVLHGVLDYLAIKGIYAWRNNTGAVKTETGFVRFGKRGSSDIIGILDDGRFLAIECKSKRGRTTPEQDEFIEDINSRGGVAFVAHDVGEAIKVINEVTK